MDEISLEKARKKLGDIVDRARLTGRATVITRHGNAAAVVAPVLCQGDRELIALARASAAAIPYNPAPGGDDTGEYIRELLDIIGRLTADMHEETELPMSARRTT